MAETLLATNAEILVTMDDDRREIAGGGFFARGGRIEAVGARDTLPATADRTIDLSGLIVTPGLINTHHHLFQNLTRAVPAAQDEPLFGWLRNLYPIWTALGPEHIRVSAALGLAELALSGCTCSSDHQYLFPNGARLDDAIEAAVSLGVRFHACRGSMTIGESKGGLPPDILTEEEALVLRDCERVVAAFHDPAPGAMIRVALAPCSPFSVSEGLMRDTAVLARELGVMLHTHLAENDEDIDYSLERFGQRPGEWAEKLGWTGADVWHAHCVKLNPGEIDLFARTGTGVAHCPCSNMRLGSGVAPIRAMRDAGVRVGLGVDGSASNDSGHLLSEARQAMLLQRAAGGAGALSAREALEIATRGGAATLGRDDLGAIAVGKRADFAGYSLSGMSGSGAWDAVAALLLCGPLQARETWVEGRAVVTGGRIATLDAAALVGRHRQLSGGLRG